MTSAKPWLDVDSYPSNPTGSFSVYGILGERVSSEVGLRRKLSFWFPGNTNLFSFGGRYLPATLHEEACGKAFRRARIWFGLALAGIILVALALFFWGGMSGRKDVLRIGGLYALLGFPYFVILQLTTKDQANFIDTWSFLPWLQYRYRRAVRAGIAAFMLVGLSQLLAVSLAGSNEALVDFAALWYAKAIAGEYFRFVTGPLLHGSLLHWLLNAIGMMFTLPLLLYMGSGYCFIALAGALSAELLAVFLSPIDASIGSSGLLMAALGCVLVGTLLRRERYPEKFNRLMFLIVALFLFAPLLIGNSGTVDHFTHFSSFACGGALSFAYAWRLSFKAR